MSTGSISLDILLNKILTDAISGGNESIRAIQKRYPSLSEKEAHEILAMVSATAQSNDDSAELVDCVIQKSQEGVIIVVMMCALLSKTHLYYANPVLAILGYRVYEITFKSNPDFNNEICLAVVKGRFLKNPSTVEYKVINDTVLYMKEMNK